MRRDLPEPPCTKVIVAVLGLALASCGPRPDHTLTEARAALDAGDFEASQAAFRLGLERHPDHLESLLFAARFYLHPEVEEHYKPRLALHYAARASRADTDGRADVAAAHVRALRAMGQEAEADGVLEGALVYHPNDPDLSSLSGP